MCCRREYEPYESYTNLDDEIQNRSCLPLLCWLILKQEVEEPTPLPLGHVHSTCTTLSLIDVGPSVAVKSVF